jgi:hypothetical protein
MDDEEVVDAVVVSEPALETPVGATRALGVVFGDGNSSCETAITTSERSRARKKRLSIQGTGS